MTDRKILSPPEALLALGEGRKLTQRWWDSDRYIALQDRNIVVFGDKRDIYGGNFSDFYEYKEPKPKRKLAPYIITTGVYTFMTDKFFESDEHVKTTWQHFTIVRRVTELEIEIE
jgi:hypothetical protein